MSKSINLKNKKLFWMISVPVLGALFKHNNTKTTVSNKNNESASKVLKSIVSTAKKEAKTEELIKELTEIENACKDIYDMFGYCHDRVDFAFTIKSLFEPLKKVDYTYYNMAYEIASATFQVYAAELYEKTFEREYDRMASYKSVSEAQDKLDSVIMKTKILIAYKKVANVFVFNVKQQQKSKEK